MAFSEKLKLEVRRMTAFRCCRCQSIVVEVHHIIPQADGGPDTIANAAPLCAKCHADFGANPAKRNGNGAGHWRKLKGSAKVHLDDGAVRSAEGHWFEAHEIGRRRIRIKRFLH